MDIKFSIGLPAFKGKFLNQSISSVLNQTYTNFELIIINDFSPDPVREIVKQFKDSRISYYENEFNIGSESVIRNWNKCLDKAHGEYFILLGDDDVMDPYYLQEFNMLIKKYPDLNIYHCRTRLIDENSNITGLTPLCPDYETVYDNIWHRINAYRIQFISDFVYNTKELKTNNGFYDLPLAWYSDDVSSYIASMEKGIAYTSKPLLNFRNSSISISTSGNPEKKMLAFHGFDEWLILFLQKEPTEKNDQLILQSIKNYYPDYKRKSIIEILINSYKEKSILKLIRWISKKKKFKLKYSYLMISFFEYYKQKIIHLFFKKNQ